jgi:release factor glutamine methyltransferase
VTDVRAELTETTAMLAAAGVASARHDAESLLAWVLGVSRSQLAAVSSLEPVEQAAYRGVVARRAQREPLQHITGAVAFRYLDLEVGPGVFIPRPETEVMTGIAIDELRRVRALGVAAPVAVDLCTGSGAVALALATEAPGSVVTGVELSEPAHAYAVRNAAGIAPAVDMRLGDISDAVDDLAGTAHVVTANPPYIPLDAYESVEAEARDHDPAVALWSGDDGLDAIRVVAAVAARLLVDGGLLVCEHADVQGESAPAVFVAHREWREVRDNRDLANRPRFVSARRVSRRSASPGTMSS